ncbi:MAG: hypothetical protein ABF899_01470 [Oenococcus sp.]|uniref:hypothetical protein n=1 Tax=Oenococcus sp. TaxID=1979414 RepID=UPI0039EC5E73
MIPTEKIEAQYYKYRFHFVCFPEHLYFLHGYINGNDIYINKNDSIEMQSLTMLHEVVHAEVDAGCDLTDHRPVKTIRSEGFANRISRRDVKRYLA